VQPDVREVVLLDRRIEAAVDLIDLAEDLLGLRLLGRDAAGIGGRRCRRTECRYANKQRLRLTSHGRVPEGAGPHKFGTLAATSDVCNRFPSQKLTLSGKWPDRTKSPISAVSRPKRHQNIPICDQRYLANGW
jgi:hypothetical protein